MKKIITLSLVLAFWGCKTNQIQETTATPMKQSGITMATIGEPIEETKEIMLTGKITKADLQKRPFDTWFNPAEESYVAKDIDLSTLKTQNQNYEIKIFMGIWCGDSKEHVPHFYKILDQINFDLNKVTLIAVDRSKTTPDRLEKNMNITHVPTFIFYKNGKEVHRIVESPVVSLENDMLKITSDQSYKHNYEN